MWGPATRLTAAAAASIAVLAVAGCGSAPSLAGPGRPPGHSGPPSAFDRRARLISQRWDASALARIWRTGLVLTGGATLIQIPDNVGFASQRQKDMFWSGHFTLATRLPGATPGNLIRWSNGTTRRIAAQDARAAFRVLSTRTPCGGPYSCSGLGNLTVTGMTPTAVTLPTSRGFALVPAWRFRVAQLSWTFTQIAVPPAAVHEQLAGRAWPQSGLASVSGDGRTLLIRSGTGWCTGYPRPHLRAQVYETATTVVIGTVVVPGRGPQGGQVCAGVGLMITVQVRLRQPLGSRVVLDAGSGLPLPTPV